MNRTPGLFLAIACIFMAGCGSEQCVINTAIKPTNATVNPASASDTVQFSLESSVKGNCPLSANANTPDSLGIWSTSDPMNTSINAQGVAQCLNATSGTVTISNSSTIRGKGYPPATLECQ